MELRWFGIITSAEDTVQCISSPKDALTTAEGRLIINGNQISLNAVPGVFVPLYLSVLMEVVMGVCHDCLWIIIRSLHLGGLACLVKEPNHSGSYHQNILISLCYRELMFDHSPRSPLSINSSSNGSRDGTQDNVPTDHIDTQPPNPTLLEGIQLAMCFS